MTTPPRVAVVGLADAELSRALAGRSLVTFDRFTSAGRTCVLGPLAVPAVRPNLTVGYYNCWSAIGNSGAVLAAELRTGVRDGVAKHRWLDDLAEDVTRACADLPGPPVFSAWYASPSLMRLAEATGAVLLTVPATVRAGLEDKTRLDSLLRLSGVDDRLRIPAITATSTPSYANASRLGKRLVVQPAATSGGRGTVFVSDRAGFERATSGTGPWRISRFINGFCSNTTVLTLPTRRGCQVYVDVPSHKPIGVTGMGIAAAKGAGNDWSPPWPGQLVAELVEAIVRLGEHLNAVYGLAGLWGVDAIFTDDRVVINEINVRNQGTTELSGVNQVLRGLPPLLIAHLTVLAGGTVSWLPPADEFNTATIERATAGGHAPFYLKLRNRNPFPVTPRPGWDGPGIYRLTNGDALVWTRPGAHPADADLDTGEVLLANAPAARVQCAPGAELGTVEGLTTRAVFSGPAQLSPLGIRLHRAAINLFAASEVEGSRP